ncbi:hypothetical protein AYO44_07880 [Planctomycetaceae bacterium SCGC AG-212-F19]|nr:hypothetical protein AYO44_07880 [Planctomycetaceae bacterium SCGC AG-212-F19]
MSDPSPPSAAAGDTAYIPISGWAIAGFGLAVLSALGISLFASVALVSGVPLQLDTLLGMLLLIALLAFALSLTAWRQVARDPGIRTGLRLARAGMLLSALFGLGYFSWSVAKDAAVGHDSRSFTDAWLERLKHSPPGSVDAYVAFWHMLPVEGRPAHLPLHDPRFEKQLRAQPEQAGQLRKYINVHHTYGASAQQPALFPLFCDDDLIQLLSRAGPEARIEPAGLRTWSYRGKRVGGFHVEQTYLITTPEGKFPAVVAALSTDTDEGRLWQVLMEGTGVEFGRRVQWTPLGENVMALRQDSREFARDWVRKLSQGMREEAFLDTLPPADRLAMRSQIRVCRLGSAVSILASTGPFPSGLPVLADPELARGLLPGWSAYASGGLLVTDDLLADPTVRLAVAEQAKALFRPVHPTAVSWPSIPAGDTRLASPWQTSKGPTPELIFLQPFGLRVAADVFCEGMIRVATSEPALLGALQPGATAVNLPPAQRPLRWRIQRVDLAAGTIVARDEK